MKKGLEETKCFYLNLLMHGTDLGLIVHIKEDYFKEYIINI